MSLDSAKVCPCVGDIRASLVDLRIPGLTLVHLFMHLGIVS
jgi:hypothetical protein